jgi:hypothetical protein
MHDNQQYILIILQKKLQKIPLTEEEQAQLNEWLQVNEEDALLQPGADEQELLEYLQLRMDGDRNRKAFEKFRSQAFTNRDVVHVKAPARMRFAWIRYAAAIIIIAGIATWFITGNRSNDRVVNNKGHRKVDIAPGHDGAILTLANGSQMVLDSLGNGVIASQNGAQVVLKNGFVQYDATGKTSVEITYNTMSTPRGRQFQLVLPDGSKVWLNAASAIKYPTTFTGKERLVEMNGEAYFEVAKDAAKPFRVKINEGLYVQVLGTNFNVNAYENEAAVKTTLLEGSVQVVAKSSVLLKPGEQAIVTQASQPAIDDKPSIDKVMAWKNGLFNFEGMRLKEVMKQLERWYDIDVVYEPGVPDIEFYGELSRNTTLIDVIAALKDSDVHFRIEGRKLIVLP